jgi:hypothetical protein
MDSLRRIDAGTFQYGRKIRYSISSANTGVRVLSARPTMTAIVRAGAPDGMPSQAQRRNIGMFTAISRPWRRSGSHRRRSSASSICRARQESGTLSASCVAGPITRSASNP